MNELIRRLRALLRRRAMGREMERELQFHLEMKALDSGDPRAARRAVGNSLSWRERAWDAWGWRWLDEIAQDVRFAVRGLGRSPGFAVAAILTLALGIGANSLIFSVMDATVLRPLPFREPERLVSVAATIAKMPGRSGMPSLFKFLTWRKAGVFEELGAQRGMVFDIGGNPYPQQISGQEASTSFFRVLGVQPELGRTFLPEEEIPGKNNVLLISHRLWRTRFGADPKVIGSRISLGGAAPGVFTIVGVLPPSIQYADRGIGDVWAPLVEEQGGNLTVVGRLRPGMTPVAAGQAISASGQGAEVFPYQEELIRSIRPMMRMLGVAVLLVLLIACVNVANLMLARGADRAQEFAVRSAIGAGRGRLVRQLLVESLVPALTGGAAGAALAYASMGAVRGLMPKGVFRGDAVSVDPRVLGFTLGVSVLACILFGLLPAMRAARYESRPDLLSVRSRPMGRGFARSALVVSQVALALMLAIAAGLMTKSFVELVWKDLGFNRQNLLTLQTGLPMDVYKDTARRIPLEREITSRLGTLPGVRYVGVSDFRPLGMGMMRVNARTSSDGAPKRADLVGVTPGFFDAMGIPVRRGRRFTDQDKPGAPAVAIVSEAAARLYWPDQDPIGRPLLIPGGGNPEAAYEVVGVVGDAVGRRLTDEPRAAIYVPHAQRMSTSALDIVVRVQPGISTDNLVPAIRAELASVNRALSVKDVLTMQSVVSSEWAQARFLTALLGTFAALALALTLTGMAGVVAYLVSTRTFEFGVRLTFGATGRSILALILGYGGRLALIGIGLGLAGAWGLGRLLRSFLYEVTPGDAVIMVSVPLLVLAAVLVACYVPARRAMRIDPVQALRHN